MLNLRHLDSTILPITFTLSLKARILELKNYLSLTQYFVSLIKPLNKQEKRIYLWIIAMMCLAILFNLFIPLSFKWLIDSLSPADHLQWVVMGCVFLYCSSWFLTQFALHTREMMSAHLIENIIARFTLHFIEKWRTNSGSIENKDNSYVLALLERMQVNFHNLFLGIVFFVFPIIVEVCIIVIGLALANYGQYALLLFITVFMFFAVSLFLVTWYSTFYSKASYDKSMLASSIYSYLNEFNELRKIQTAKKTLLESLDNNKQSQALQFINLKIIRLSQCLILGTGFCIIIVMSVDDVLSRSINISDLVLINGYFFQLLPPLNLVALVLRDVARGLATLGEMKSMQNIVSNPACLRSVPKEVVLN